MKKLFTLLCIALTSHLGFTQTWQNLNCPAPGGQLGDIDGTNSTIYATRLTGGFYKSTDGGGSWHDVTTNYPTGQTQNFVCLNSGNILLAIFTGSSFPWYHSTDGGASWTTIAGSPPIGGGVAKESPNGTVYWIPSYDGFSTTKTSTNEGTTWNPTTAVLKSISFTTNGDAYGLRYDSGAGETKLSKSTDNGQTWTDLIAAGIPFASEYIAVSPNGNIYVSAGAATHKSTDDGSSFTSIDTLATALYTDYNNNLFTRHTSKLNVTADAGASWLNATSGLIYPSGTVGNIWAHPDGTTYASNYNPGTGTWGIYKYNGGSAGLSEDEAMANLTIYPNPTSDLLNINGLSVDGNYTIQIIDLNGKVIQTINGIKGVESTNVQVINLSSGTYILQVNDVNTKISKQMSWIKM